MHMQQLSWEGSNLWAGNAGLYKAQGTQDASCMHPKCTTCLYIFYIVYLVGGVLV